MGILSGMKSHSQSVPTSHTIYGRKIPVPTLVGVRWFIGLIAVRVFISNVSSRQAITGSGDLRKKYAGGIIGLNPMTSLRDLGEFNSG